MRFRCGRCGELHEGTPAFGWDEPVPYLAVAERERRCFLASDACVIDDAHFFVRGCLEVPVLEEEEVLSWGVWVSLSETNFHHFQDLLDEPRRSGPGPFFGWPCSFIGIFPDTLNLKTRVHLRDDGIRPFIELEPTDHPLAVEQRAGITLERVREIFEAMVHPAETPAVPTR